MMEASMDAEQRSDDKPGFIDKLTSIAETKAIMAGGSAGFALGSAAATNLGLPAFFIAAPAAPGMLIVGGTIAGAYFAYRIVNSVLR